MEGVDCDSVFTAAATGSTGEPPPPLVNASPVPGDPFSVLDVEDAAALSTASPDSSPAGIPLFGLLLWLFENAAAAVLLTLQFSELLILTLLLIVFVIVGRTHDDHDYSTTRRIHTAAGLEMSAWRHFHYPLRMRHHIPVVCCWLSCFYLLLKRRVGNSLRTQFPAGAVCSVDTESLENLK